MQDVHKNRSSVFVIGLSFIFLLFLYRIGTLQLVDDKYEKRAINNALNKITLYPARSVIYDRFGKIIAKNAASYDLFVFPKDEKVENRLFVQQILQIDSNQYNELLTEAWINSKKRQKNNAYNRSAIFYSNLSQQQYTALRENLYRLSGFYIEPRTDRSYEIFGGAHAFGYLGEASELLLKEDPYYQPGDLVGITGIERYYEEFMRGAKGIKTVWQDRTYKQRGEVQDEAFNYPAKSGPDFYATIDIELQKFAEELFNGKRGSVVAIEPSTGEILAFLNKPDYNPNDLVGQDRARSFRKMLIDPKKPLYNRAVKGVYPPGSTVKTVLALIGLQEGIIHPGSTKGCGGGYRMGNIVVGCHPHGGPLDVVGSIRISCNSYYCGLFREIIDHPKYGTTHNGYRVLERYWRSFGLGDPTGIDLLGESSGNVPTVERLAKRHGKKWRSSMVISLGIGQGEILLTPLQLANVAAILANRGYYIPPHLLKKVNGLKNNGLKQEYRTKKIIPIEAKHFETVIEGMSQVMKPGGTANGIGINGIEICGKTGTAQNPHGKDHSLFIAFAPRNNPKIAIGVIVENGGFGATYAAPIATLMIEKYLMRDTASSKQFMIDRLKSTVLEPQ
jgi:penicillin-binding protein 2